MAKPRDVDGEGPDKLLWIHQRALEEVQQAQLAHRQFVAVRSVQVRGVAGDYTRHVVVVDANGSLDPKEVADALERHFCPGKRGCR